VPADERLTAVEGYPVTEKCGECQLLESRVAEHQGDLRRAARRALRAGPRAHEEAVQIKGRIQRAQRHLLEHSSVAHRV
jgi:hypothetical protein